MEPLQIIKLGSTGASVINWQNFLLNQGYQIIGTADGNFGPDTDTATKQFQTNAGLTADGIVGNKTYATAIQIGFNAVLEIADFLGIDVYHGDGIINWTNVKADKQNIKFAYLKATEGIGFSDQTFVSNRTNAGLAGIQIGAYHFYHPELSPVDQANFFCKAIGILASGDLPPAMDFEPVGLSGITAKQVIEDLHTFLDMVKSNLGVQPIIYTNHNSWVNVLGNPTEFNDYQLWLASFNGGVNLPALFGGWSEWAIWQYTDGGYVDGISNHTVDMNKYNVNSKLL